MHTLPLLQAMEIPPPSSMTSVAAIFGLLLLIISLYFTKKKSAAAAAAAAPKKRAAPEASGAWPVVGHAPLLAGAELPHKVFGEMADKHGPIFTVRVGVRRVLVVSDWEIVKECFTTNDVAFAQRPTSVAAEVMSYNYAMFGFGPYGAYWRQLRRILTTQLLSNTRLEVLKRIWASEVKASIKDMYKLWADKRGSGSDMVAVEMKDWFGKTALDMVLRILVGKSDSSRNEDERKPHRLAKDFFRLLGTFAAADAFPILRRLDLGGHEKAMKKTAEEIDELLESWLQQHRLKGSSAADGSEDFMSAMISILEEMAASEDLKCFDADTINKATCLTVLVGATDTTTITLIWAFALLLNNPRVLKKAREEIDMHVGSKRQVEEEDMKNLPYLYAIIKETMRLYPAGPVSGHHQTMEDCTVAGYHVPANTSLLLNVWRIHRDPRIWLNPDSFEPERFLTNADPEIDVKGAHQFGWLPFGAGRRICPGISLSLQFMQFTLASLIHGFEFKTKLDEPVDMTEGIELTSFKVTPFDVLVTPRLSYDLYE